MIFSNERRQTFELKLKFLLLATLGPSSFSRGLNVGQISQPVFRFCFLCVFINHKWPLFVCDIYIRSIKLWVIFCNSVFCAFFFFNPVLFFRFIHDGTLSLLIDFDCHMLFWKFSTFAVPQAAGIQLVCLSLGSHGRYS